MQLRIDPLAPNLRSRPEELTIESREFAQFPVYSFLMANSPSSSQQNSLDLAAILLAGGQSKRMGRDKALIQTNGMPMLQQICEVAQDCCPRVYVVTPWPERYRALLPTDCQMMQEARPPDAH